MPRRRKRKRGEGGATLAELLVALGVFSAAMVGMFALFSKSYQSYRFLLERQSLQSQVVALSQSLEADFRRTHFATIRLEPVTRTVGGVEVQRDRVSCLGLDNWFDPDNFAPMTAIPRWNQHLVYRCQGEDSARLERLVFRPAGSASLPVRPLNLPLDSLPEAGIWGRRVLAEDVFSWGCRLQVVGQSIEQTVQLRRATGRRGLDDQSSVESLEARFRWSPQNTIPKL